MKETPDDDLEMSFQPTKSPVCARQCSRKHAQRPLSHCQLSPNGWTRRVSARSHRPPGMRSHRPETVSCNEKKLDLVTCAFALGRVHRTPAWPRCDTTVDHLLALPSLHDPRKLCFARACLHEYQAGPCANPNIPSVGQVCLPQANDTALIGLGNRATRERCPSWLARRKRESEMRCESRRGSMAKLNPTAAVRRSHEVTF